MDKFEKHAEDMLDAQFLNPGGGTLGHLTMALSTTAVLANAPAVGTDWTEVADAGRYSRIVCSAAFTVVAGASQAKKILSSVEVTFGDDAGNGFSGAVTIRAIVLGVGAGAAFEGKYFLNFTTPVSVSAGDSFRFVPGNLSCEEL